MTLKDETGKRYGKRKVIRRSGSIGRNAAWLCRCDCGTEQRVSGANLRRGNSQSCGCSWKLALGEAAFNQKLANMMKGATRRGYEWNLTREQIATLTKQNCYYCGVEPQQEAKHPHCTTGYIYNGIDRIDNNKGYTIDNVVPCCDTCNYAKRTTPYKEFLAWIDRVYQYQHENL